MNYRELDDGSRMFPSRGKPPPEQPGFMRDPGNAFILRPIFPDCPLRKQQSIFTECCDKEIRYWACEAGVKVTYNNCLNCIKTGQQLVRVTSAGKSLQIASTADSTQS